MINIKKILIFVFLIFICLATDKILAADLPAQADKVEINTASLQQLETLAGIGPVKAQAIIDTRPFFSIDDLIRVNGIGEKTLQKIKDQGIAYVSDASETISNSQFLISNENQNTQNQNTNPPPAPTPALPPTYPSDIFINELLPNPDGPDEQDEWIEIYNGNNFEANLSNWRIHDTDGKTANYIFPDGTKIQLNGFLLLTRPITKITLNNIKDGLVLAQPDGKIADEINYQNAPKNQSYNKTISGWPASNASPASNAVSTAGWRSDAGWTWSETLTPSLKNIVSVKNKIADEKTTEFKNNELDKEKLLASLKQSNNKKSGFKNTLSVAFGIVVLFAIIFYYSKRFLAKKR